MHRRRALFAQFSSLVAAMALTASAASAQVSITFFDSYPAAPNPLGAFGGGAALCSASAVGTANGGFSLDFNNAAIRQALCPANPDRFDVNHSYGARITGNLSVAATGLYNVTFDADDGDALALNGVVVRTDWVIKASGPGSIQLQLNAGLNPFVFDFFQGPCCGSYATMIPGDGVTITPPPPVTTTPEPSSLVLTAMGILAVAVGARRARRTA